MNVARYSSGEDAFAVPSTRVLPAARVAPVGDNRGLDAHPDGRQVAFVTAAPGGAAVNSDDITFAFNFGEVLQRLGPSGR